MTSLTAAEAKRLARLHETFVAVRAGCAADEKLAPQLRRLTKRALREPYCGYAYGSIRRLYRRWLRKPSPQTLARKWKPGKPRISEPLLREFLRRLVAEPTKPQSRIVQEMVDEWRAGAALPGIGSWRDSHTAMPSRFPVSTRSFFRYVGALLPISWEAQRRRRKAALRELAALDAMIDQHLCPRATATATATE